MAKAQTRSYVAQHKAATAKPQAAPPQRTKKTVVDPVTPVSQSSVQDDIKRLFAKYSVAVPSTTRVVINFIACAVVGAGIGYIGSALIEMLVLGAFAFTGSVFLSVALYVLGVVVTLYLAYKAGGYVGDAIMSGRVDRSYQKYSNVVRGWFGRGDVVAA